MMLRYSLGDGATADRIEGAVEKALQDGYRTGDIKEDGCKLVSTSEMGDAVAQRV
jgi:3-isopropylmalate dehydrogenase